MTEKFYCKTCGCEFTLTEKQIKYYVGRGWTTPKHCRSCREENREEKQSQYYGLLEAMSNYTPCKKRRQRVHYRPHLVGGFR